MTASSERTADIDQHNVIDTATLNLDIRHPVTRSISAGMRIPQLGVHNQQVMNANIGDNNGMEQSDLMNRETAFMVVDRDAGGDSADEPGEDGSEDDASESAHVSADQGFSNDENENDPDPYDFSLTPDEQIRQLLKILMKESREQKRELRKLKGQLENRNSTRDSVTGRRTNTQLESGRRAEGMNQRFRQSLGMPSPTAESDSDSVTATGDVEESLTQKKVLELLLDMKHVVPPPVRIRLKQTKTLFFTKYTHQPCLELKRYGQFMTWMKSIYSLFAVHGIINVLVGRSADEQENLRAIYILQQVIKIDELRQLMTDESACASWKAIVERSKTGSKLDGTHLPLRLMRFKWNGHEGVEPMFRRFEELLEQQHILDDGMQYTPMMTSHMIL